MERAVTSTKLINVNQLFYDLVEISLQFFSNIPGRPPLAFKIVYCTVLAYLIYMLKKKEQLREIIQSFIIVS
jgi:hypothetical protein